MKQVQWDEDGMTWDVHGASVDPEVLSTAIKKHLELQNSPRTLRHSSKKKKAPKPPLISSAANAIASELNPTATIRQLDETSTCTVDGESGEKPGVEEEGGAKNEEAVEVPRRLSRAEGNDAEEEDEVYGQDGSSHPRSPSRRSGHIRKKSMIRSLRRTGWCGGGSRKGNHDPGA